MEKFRASHHLIELLLKHGFKDLTKKDYPEHYTRMVDKDYEPSSIKRLLAINKNNYIIFDYINIKPFYNESCKRSKTELTHNELKSIIAFFKLPANIKTELHKNIDITDLHLEYAKIKQNIRIYKNKKSKTLVDTFESIILE